jgi:carbamoyltransferase
LRVLGIAPDVWISSAALIEDGRVVAAAAEERFNRQKMSRSFPKKAMEFCLRQAGIGIEDVDRIAVPWNPGVHVTSASGRFISGMRWRGEYLSSVPGELLNQLGSPLVHDVEEVLRIPNKSIRVVFVHHHLAHAANGFWLSPFKRAAILTVDGRGEEETCTFCIGKDSGIEKLNSVLVPHSLGLFYGSLTQFLGFAPDSDEWKVMALASYGDAGVYYKKLRGLLNLLEDGRFETDLTYFTYYLFDKQPRMFTLKLEELLGPARQSEMPIQQRHKDIAAAMQRVFEECVTHMLHHLHTATGEDNLVLSGGCAMNSVYNGRVLQNTSFKEVFVSSCPDDSGASVGAALYVCHTLHGGSESHPQSHNYWGPGYADSEIKETLGKYKIEYEYHENTAKVAARFLSEGKLLGWFQGRMEFGQRALGNRSILADPRNVRSKDLVNAAVKYRESFRPFAPSVLEDKADGWFVIPKGLKVPFMEKVFPVRPERRDQIPAVVHVDGSCRLQTVSKTVNAPFYELIQEFEKLTNVPVVLNTSFNLNGEPIVCTPTDAIRAFFSCGLDVLLLGNFVVRKS